MEARINMRASPLAAAVVLFTAVSAIAVHADNSNNVVTYSVLNAGQSTSPKLTALQRAWLARIHRTPAYRPYWKRLRYSMVPPGQLPLIVYLRGGDLDTVVNADCTFRFNSYTGLTQSIPGDVCTGSSSHFFEWDVAK